MGEGDSSGEGVGEGDCSGLGLGEGSLLGDGEGLGSIDGLGEGEALGLGDGEGVGGTLGPNGASFAVCVAATWPLPVAADKSRSGTSLPLFLKNAKTPIIRSTAITGSAKGIKKLQSCSSSSWEFWTLSPDTSILVLGSFPSSITNILRSRATIFHTFC